jgi:tetratricopeptide (TPR) repeat protein
MEKNRLLGARYRALCLIVFTLFISSCSLPRILVLHDPLTPEEHINLGVAYEGKGELDAALKEYRLASGKLPIAYLYAGNVYFQKKEFPDAEKAYKKAIEKTDDPTACNNLAWLYYVTDGDLQKALDLSRKAVSLAPESTQFKDTRDKIVERIEGRPRQ